MRRLLIVVLVSLAGCAVGRHDVVPNLQEQSENFAAGACDAVFPASDWQFVHSISFSMSDGKGSVVIGATTLSDEGIRSALMTVEGLTLFEAELVEGVGMAIYQALPPFNRPEFAAGLMDDIQTIFRKPQGLVQTGKTAEGEKLCRYTGSSGEVTDVYPKVNNCWLVRKYSSQQVLERTVSGCLGTPADSSDFPNFPNYLQLEAIGMTGYSLKMKLLSAVPMQ